MIKKYILVAIFGVNIVYANEGNQTFSLKQVLASYQKALQQLILAHDQLYPKQQLQVDNDRLVMQTYQKLLNPCVTWICGYAQIVSSQLVRGIDVEADLNHLFHVYMEYEHEVKQIVSLFSAASQKDFMDVFYDAVASRVVQVGFDIVQKSSYQYKFDQKALQTVYQAYQLAWHAQTNNMKILGCTTKSDFQQKISQNIQILFSAAINHYQSLLQQGMIDAESLQSTYKILEWCTHVLYEVYKNNGNVQNAAIEQSLLQNFASQQQAYQQGLLQQQQADSKIQQTRNLITLNYAQATTVLNDVTASLKAFSVVQKLYQNAEQNFNSSGNVVGTSSVAIQLAILNEYDILFRFIQKLWALFLIDQSSQNVISFPSLAAFVQGNAAGQVSNAVQALSNVSGMLSNQYVTENNMIALTGTTQDLLITSIFDDMQNFAQKNCTHHGMVTKDALFNVPLLLHAQQVVNVMVEWCNALIQAGSNSDQNMAQNAMGYAHVLDTYFQNDVDLIQLIPHLPDCLSTNKTWVNFTAQFLVQAGVVAQVAQAMNLISAAHIQMPEVLSAQDLQNLKQTAKQLWNQAETLTKAQKFASAATIYQTIMTHYQTLYANASDANAMIEYSEKANIAQTRFTALSLASNVQPIGSITFATIKNIPTLYVARSYSVSIDPAILNNSIPPFLSSLSKNESLNQISVLQKQELMALLKAYLIAQDLNDQGLSFSSYYSDYQLTVVQHSKRVGLTEEKITNYLNVSAQLDIASVTVGVDGMITLVISGFPLELVTPICSTISSVVNFYQSAALLLEPSTQPMVFGGQSYVSGNDAATAQVLYQKVAYVYLAQVAEYMKKANVVMKQTLAVIGKTNTLPENFSNVLSTINGYFARMQALMYSDLEGSAYQNLIKAGLHDQAQIVEQKFLSSYSDQIAFGQKCLVGNPMHNNYQNLISMINQWYVSLGTYDTSQLATINQNIAQLYENAGQSVLKFKYIQHSFVNFEQINYMLAASYLRSAQQQYQTLNNTAQVQVLEDQINDCFFRAVIQKLNVYQYVLVHGVYYNSIQNQNMSVSYYQLQIDYNNAQQNGAEIDPNEMHAYNQVQNLLLDASLVLSHLQNVAQADVSSVVSYLQQQKIIKNKITDFAQISLTENNQIFVIANKIYEKFAKNNAALSACAQMLFNVVKDQYLQNYLGIDATSTAAQIANATQEFLASMQQEILNLTNPSVGYVQ